MKERQLKKIYCCRCKKLSWEEEQYSVLLLESSDESESFDEVLKENFSLCSACKNEFVKVFMHKTNEEPHQIVNEDDLLMKASREDVRDFLETCGVNEDMALFISERVRRGQVASSGWREDMLEVMKKTDVPDWFFDACKKIKFLAKRENYRPPYLMSDNRPNVKVSGVSILSESEFEKNKDLIHVRRPFWCRVDDSVNQKEKCGVIICPDRDVVRLLARKWGSVYPVLILEASNQLELGSKLLYAGDEYIVLRDGLAICDSEYRYVSFPVVCANSFKETYLSEMLADWFRDNGTVADVVDK